MNRQGASTSDSGRGPVPAGAPTSGILSPDTIRFRWWILAGVLHITVVGLYFIVPIAGRWSTALLGTSGYPYDNILNAGILEWGYHSLLSGGRDLFEWPPGFPLGQSLAGTENLIGWQSLYAPLRLLGLSEVAAFNALFSTALLLGGLSTMALARHFGLGYPGAVVSGLAVTTFPFLISMTVQLQNLAVFCLPLMILFADRFLYAPRARETVLLSMTGLIALCLSVYAGIFFLLSFVLFALVSWLVGHRALTRAHVLHLAVGIPVLVLLTAPLLRPYLSFLRDHGFAGGREELVEKSLSVLGFFQAPAWHAAWKGMLLEEQPGYAAAFPGWVVVLLALVGLVLGVANAKQRKTTVVLGAMVALMAALSLGPELKIYNYPTRAVPRIPMPGELFAWIPGLRTPMRMFLYAAPFLAILVGLGAQAGLDRFRGPRIRFAIFVAVVGILVLEQRPSEGWVSGALDLPRPLEISDAYGWLSEAPQEVAVVELPNEYSWDGVGVQALYVYGAAGHRRRTASYYAGVLPEAPLRLHALAKELPSAFARDDLIRAGVTHAIVHRHLLGPVEGPRAVEAFRVACYTAVHEGLHSTVYDLRESVGC